jgi:hypothetical protein
MSLETHQSMKKSRVTRGVELSASVRLKTGCHAPRALCRIMLPR